MSNEKNKYFILYNNGRAETTDRVGMALLHMIEMGVIKIIFNCNENKAWIVAEDGVAKEINITHVTGLQ